MIARGIELNAAEGEPSEDPPFYSERFSRPTFEEPSEEDEDEEPSEEDEDFL